MVAAVVHAHAAEFVGPECAILFIVVIFRIWAGGTSVLCSPAVPTGENVLDALIGMEFRGLPSPGRCESSTI